MGSAKDALIEADERGWSEIDEFVCPECVEDEALKEIVRSHATAMTCSYCGNSSEPAAPVAALQEALYEVIETYYNQPDNAGVPYEGGYLIEPRSTDYVLGSLGFDGHPQLLADLVEADMDRGWVPAADGHWASLHEHEVLLQSWHSFESLVKYEVRYHFGRVGAPEHSQEISPRELLEHVGRRLRQYVTQIPAGTLVYRVRVRRWKESWQPTAAQLGAPPPESARSGRMNPVGIPYLYTSIESETALREAVTVRRAGDAVFVATFETTRAIQCIDLTRLPPLPSLLDLARKDEREDALFLKGFVEAICRPIRKNGQEHVEYVPTQVVSEYLAQEFRTKDGDKLAGLIFPSSVKNGGRNLVVFPDERGWSPSFNGVDFRSASFARRRNPRARRVTMRPRKSKVRPRS